MSKESGQSQFQPRKIGGLDPRHVRHLNSQRAALTRIAKPKNMAARALLVPAIVTPVWFHADLGWFWAAMIACAAVAWIWSIPSFRKPTQGAGSWLQKATIGERMWLNRMFVPVPKKLHQAALLILMAGLFCLSLSIMGAVFNKLPLVLIPGLMTYFCKFGSMFIMVQIYEDLKNAHPLYKGWRSIPGNDNSLKAKVG